MAAANLLLPVVHDAGAAATVLVNVRGQDPLAAELLRGVVQQSSAALRVQLTVPERVQLRRRYVVLVVRVKKERPFTDLVG